MAISTCTYYKSRCKYFLSTNFKQIVILPYYFTHYIINKPDFLIILLSSDVFHLWPLHGKQSAESTEETLLQRLPHVQRPRVIFGIKCDLDILEASVNT